METSAKTSDGVQQTFIMATKMLFKKHQGRIKQARKSLQDKVDTKKLKKSARNDGAQKKQSCGC